MLYYNWSYTDGLAKGVVEAASMNARAFGMFLKSQKSWKQKELDEGTVNRFQIAMKVKSINNYAIICYAFSVRYNFMY